MKAMKKSCDSSINKTPANTIHQPEFLYAIGWTAPLATGFADLVCGDAIIVVKTVPQLMQ